MAKIGIFGGTFDPIHLGHLRSAYEVQHKLALQGLYFVPCAQPVHRQTPNVSAAMRLAMVELAIADVANWQVSDVELARQGASYTVDTLAYFKQALPADTELWFILGSDAFAHFLTWHRWQEILQLANIAVMTRAEHPVIYSAELQRVIQQGELAKNGVGRIQLLSLSPLPISSTQIRADFARQQPPYFQLTDAVMRFIQQHQLYQNINTLSDTIVSSASYDAVE